jgi:hypothetical protein
MGGSSETTCYRVTIPSRTSTGVWSIVALAIVLLPGRTCHAGNSPGLYAGGAVGRSRVEASAPPALVNFSEGHSAFKVFAGVRPVHVIGAEIVYFDLGHPVRTVPVAPFGTADDGDVAMKGVAAFAMLYLPVRAVDIYLKAGVASVQSKLDIGIACPAVVGAPCEVFPIDRTDTSFAGGAGVQRRFGRWSVRAEYEQFYAAGGHPNLLSLGLILSF